MCRCAAAIARAVVAFLDAVLVGCLLSCFRPRPRRGSGSGCRDAFVHRDRAVEHREDVADGGGIEDELRQESDNMSMNAPATDCKSVFEANPSEGCEEYHMLRSELKSDDTQHLPGVDSVPPAILEKSPFRNLQYKLLDHSVSPFPTPLVLRDDMQTPGTVYTSHRGASMSGKRVQTRKQFIYPILRPIENRLEQMEVREDSLPLPSSNPPKRRNLEADSFKKPGSSETPSSFSRQVKEALSPEELLDGGELSKTNSDEKNASLRLSHWVKSSSTDAENQGDVNGEAGDQSYDECSFPTEKPVFMASDLNWDIENPTPRLSKTWDGNGIPNTATRYKEDQKVSWHTTPFEERLLKVLSGEDHCPPRKVVRGKLFHLEEKTE
ncbi:hypothetical protein BAE44_0012296 [Dichanthelium oligosanthes]|uniref:Protein JASON n=1 Tax=Dichanthelium oligosanthes TaxID=888268 RepID=A0A1E5VNH2_9POAL|nr:hypothetical protein BAE44_0012296 [Dichanthelium oligosanthes]